MIKKVFLALFIFILIEAHSSGVKIYGKIDNATDFELKLKKSVDYVSRDSTIARQFIDSSGYFAFNIEIKHPQLVSLKCGFQVASFYIEPNKEYELRITYDDQNEFISYLADQRLLYDFVNEKENDLNMNISKFDAWMDNCIIKNYERIYKLRPSKIQKSKANHLLDSIHKIAVGRFSRKGDYLLDYIEYRFAQIKLGANVISYNDCIVELFLNQPIQYNHFDYMVFFYSFFDEYLMKHCDEIPLSKLKELASAERIDPLLEEMKKLIYFQDDRFRELVLIVNLYNMFYSLEFNPTKILSFLKYFAQNAQFSEHKVIASNFIYRIEKLQTGKRIPDFTLNDLRGGKHQVSDYKGKYLLINFWTLDCKDCYPVIDSLEIIQHQYIDRLKVINLSNSRNLSDLNVFLEKHNYQSQFCISKPDNDIYEYLKIKSLPTSILLDEKGKIKLYPAILREWGYQKIFGLIFK